MPSIYLFLNRSTLFLCSLIVYSSDVSSADARPEDVCDEAAAVAASEFSVPLPILRAVTRAETGQSKDGELSPWPWAVNVEGQGFWFRSKDVAVNHVQNHIRETGTNVDVGCFQLNYRWHGDAFSSISDMFDPFANARYAARFLSELYDEKGNWMRAVGAYHSRTPEHAIRYKRRFSEIYAELQPNVARIVSPMPTRQNRFPLLQHSNSRPGPGSLVPLGEATSRGALIPQNGKI